MLICLDLEGPLSPQDNAYEVMGLFVGGKRIFEAISRYDDLLTLEGKEGYEPGDTLKLILPFLILHNVSEEEILSVSRRARIVDGAKELVDELQAEGWAIYVISTSYEQHAFQIAEQLGIPRQRVWCTRLRLEELRKSAKAEELERVRELERELLEKLGSEEELKLLLDRFYWQELQQMTLGKVMRVEVMGGSRKVKAVETIMKREGVDTSQLVVVGDSITDYKMLDFASKLGGLAIVFNGNEYALPYADVGLASSDLRFLWPLLDAFRSGGKEKALEIARALEGDPRSNLRAELQRLYDSTRRGGFPPRFHVLREMPKEQFERVLRIHKAARSFVRGEAGKLG